MRKEKASPLLTIHHWVDHGMFIYFELGLFASRLHVQPTVVPKVIATQITEVRRPMFNALCGQGVRYSSVTKDFFDPCTDIYEDEGTGGGGLTGVWLFA